MSSRRASPTMLPSRNRASVEVLQQPRHIPRTLPQATSTFTLNDSHMMQPNYALVTGSFAGSFHQPTSCMPLGDDVFFSGNDGSYIPTSAVALADLSLWNNLESYDADTTSTSSSSGSSQTSLSPPLSEAEILQTDLYQTSPLHLGMDPLSQCVDPWVNFQHGMPPTPPADSIFDIPDMFNTGKNEPMAFAPLPEPAAECEYLGISKLQFSRSSPKHTQPRPIRSASERSPDCSVSGSPKDEPLERVKNNPRNDPRYDVKADKDGYFHCPYASEACNHKPTKQKCIYAKNLDSHLKPYTCKYGSVDENCRSLRFSSNACLFRHEREMHGLHNHGINPYLCKFPGCERARRDNGFPRRWNQRDHMKRVHGWEEPNSDDSADKSYTDPRRKKGSGASTSVPMKRVSSSRTHPYVQGQLRNVSTPRYTAQMQRELQAQNLLIPGMAIDPGHYLTQQVATQTYGAGLYTHAMY